MPRGICKAVKEEKKQPKRRGRSEKTPTVESGSITRQITDTVGIVLTLPIDHKLPEVGSTVHVVAEKGEQFDLRVSHIHTKVKKRGYCVWCWLRKGEGDGPRWRSCRLQMATITY